MFVALVSTVFLILAGYQLERQAGISLAAVAPFYAALSAGFWIAGTRLHRRQLRRLARADVRPELGQPERRRALVAFRAAVHLRNLALGAGLAAVIPLLRLAAP